MREKGPSNFEGNLARKIRTPEELGNKIDRLGKIIKAKKAEAAGKKDEEIIIGDEERDITPEEEARHHKKASPPEVVQRLKTAHVLDIPKSEIYKPGDETELADDEKEDLLALAKEKGVSHVEKEKKEVDVDTAFLEYKNFEKTNSGYQLWFRGLNKQEVSQYKQDMDELNILNNIIGRSYKDIIAGKNDDGASLRLWMEKMKEFSDKFNNLKKDFNEWKRVTKKIGDFTIQGKKGGNIIHIGTSKEAKGAPVGIHENLLDDDFTNKDKEWFEQGNAMDNLSTQIAVKKAELAKFGVFSIFSKEKRAQKAQLKVDIVNLEQQMRELLSVKKTEKRKEDKEEEEILRGRKSSEHVSVVSGEISDKRKKLKAAIAQAERDDRVQVSGGVGRLAATIAGVGLGIAAATGAANKAADYGIKQEEAKIKNEDAAKWQKRHIKEKIAGLNKIERALVQPRVKKAEGVAKVHKTMKPRQKNDEYEVAKGAGGIDIVNHKPISVRNKSTERDER